MRKRINKKMIIIIVCSILFVLLSAGLIYAFVTKDDNKNDTKEEIKEPEVKEEKEQKKVTIIDVDSKTRPYAVMINSVNEALPQSGLDKAYIVYELMVEYGITRMLALFKDVDFDKVGSIRSARTQYLGYVYENDAFYVHAGGAQDALERISSERINDIDVDGPYGVRDVELRKTRAYEHTLFTNSSLLSKAVEDRGYRKTAEVENLLTYSADELDLSKYETKQANNVSIKYSDYRTSNYSYDSNSKTYLRSMNDTKNIDLVTGEQYHVKNIIVYAVNHSTYTHHGYYGYQKLDNVGSGEGYYITDGVALPITWSKSNEKSQTVYKIKEDGKELVVNDGNTYIQVYPTTGNLSIN